MKDLKLKPRNIPRGEVWTKKCEGGCRGFVADDRRFCDHCIAARYGLYLHQTYDALDHEGQEHLYRGEAVDVLLHRLDAILGDDGYAALLAYEEVDVPEDLFEYEKSASVKIRAHSEEEAERIAAKIDGAFLGPDSSLTLDDSPVYEA